MKKVMVWIERLLLMWWVFRLIFIGREFSASILAMLFYTALVVTINIVIEQMQK